MEWQPPQQQPQQALATPDEGALETFAHATPPPPPPPRIGQQQQQHDDKTCCFPHVDTQSQARVKGDGFAGTNAHRGYGADDDG